MNPPAARPAVRRSLRCPWLTLGCVLLASCAHPTLGGPAARALVKGGALLLDVRSPGEFSEGHLPGALNVPVPELEASLGSLSPDKARPIVVYCSTGLRSARVRSRLLRAGFMRVEDLGALSNWK